MPATPKRARREPRPGSRFLSDVLADNLRSYRALRKLSQEDIAERMQAVGHATWVRATVSEVERANRALTIDEVLALALILGVTIGALLDATGIDGTEGRPLDFSSRHKPMPALQARVWVRGKAVAALKWEDGPGGIDFHPAPNDPVNYTTGALVALVGSSKRKAR